MAPVSGAIFVSTADDHFAGSGRGQRGEWIEHGYAERREMSEVARQDSEAAMLRCCGNDDVGKSWRMAEATRAIRQRAGDPRGGRIKGENAITV